MLTKIAQITKSNPDNHGRKKQSITLFHTPTAFAHSKIENVEKHG